MNAQRVNPSKQAPSLDEPEILCEARHVSHDFVLPNGKPLRVLENISVAVASNEVVALLGPSGSGKSTVLRILAGLIKPSHGDVLYRGQPLHGLNPGVARSEEHTSELQSRLHLVCRLLLEKKKTQLK